MDFINFSNKAVFEEKLKVKFDLWMFIIPLSNISNISTITSYSDVVLPHSVERN